MQPMAVFILTWEMGSNKKATEKREIDNEGDKLRGIQ
jgi:hypothetical protein